MIHSPTVPEANQKLNREKIHFLLMIPLNEMTKYFRAGMLYLLNTMTEHYDRLTSLRYNTREVVLLLEILLQGVYLVYKHSTFNEAFYGFKRSSISKDFRLKTFRKLHMLVTVMFETIMPYLKEKLL